MQCLLICFESWSETDSSMCRQHSQFAFSCGVYLRSIDRWYSAAAVSVLDFKVKLQLWAEGVQSDNALVRHCLFAVNKRLAHVKSHFELIRLQTWTQNDHSLLKILLLLGIVRRAHFVRKSAKGTQILSELVRSTGAGEDYLMQRMNIVGTSGLLDTHTNGHCHCHEKLISHKPFRDYDHAQELRMQAAIQSKQHHGTPQIDKLSQYDDTTHWGSDSLGRLTVILWAITGQSPSFCPLPSSSTRLPRFDSSRLCCTYRSTVLRSRRPLVSGGRSNSGTAR